MSGGSHEYTYARLDIYDDMPKKYKDILKVIHDLRDLLYEYEWWKSGDTGKDDFDKAAAKFRRKYLKGKEGK